MATVVHHFGMTVADIKETQDFYEKHFGFVPSADSMLLTEDWFGTGVAHDGAQAKIAWLRRDEAVIELHGYGPAGGLTEAGGGHRRYFSPTHRLQG